MQNPFTTTFSKMPGTTYIPTEQVSQILDNFSYDIPSESVYKITGVRGSGKTVLLAKIEEEIQTNKQLGEQWRVYRLSPARDMLRQLAAHLYEEPFIKKKRSGSLSISATILGSGGGIGLSSSENENMFDIGMEIRSMLKAAQKEHIKILIGVDEVSKTNHMIVFASEYGIWLREGFHVYLVCTGLYENITQLSNVKNLTFFRRASTIQTSPLNFVRMTEMYKDKLDISGDDAKQLARATKGYPYAFQEMGVLYFKKKASDSVRDIFKLLKTELFAYAYEKIWEELPEGERSFLSVLSSGEAFSRADIISNMSAPQNYSPYRDHLIKKGLITSIGYGTVALALPYFGDYIKEYC